MFVDERLIVMRVCQENFLVISETTNMFISLRVCKCGFTHASRAEVRIFTPRDIKFRTILVLKNVFLTSVITHTRQKTFHRTRIVMYYYVVEEGL